MNSTVRTFSMWFRSQSTKELELPDRVRCFSTCDLFFLHKTILVSIFVGHTVLLDARRRLSCIPQQNQRNAIKNADELSEIPLRTLAKRSHSIGWMLQAPFE